MFDSPSGRITIQQEWNGTVLSIRAARNWTLLFLAFWLAIWVTLPFAMVMKAFSSLAHPQSIQLFNLAWSIGWLFGVCFAVSQITWALGGREILRISPAELSLRSTLFGLTLRTRTVPTSEVRNLRFTPSYRSGRNTTPSRIVFEDARSTVKFGSGLEDSEAITVINTMLAIYPFPKQDAALAYITGPA